MALIALAVAFGAFHVLARRLESRIAKAVERQSARLGAQARLDGLRVSLVPALRASGLVVEKPGAWLVRGDGLQVRLTMRGRTGWGAFARVSVDSLTVSFPGGVELQVEPTQWEVTATSAELRNPVEGLTVQAASGPDGRRLEAKADGLATDRLGQLRIEGGAVPGPGVVFGEAVVTDAGEAGQELRFRTKALGAESHGEAKLTGGSGAKRIDLSIEAERLDLARLYEAFGVERPSGAASLGTLRAQITVTGPLAEPEQLAVNERLEFTPPPTLPPAVTRLRGEFDHEVVTSDGQPKTIAVSPASSDFIARPDLPPLFVQTLLLAEDAAFFSHRGLDLKELPRAMATNWTRGTTVRGASTITQQLAKNLFLTREKSLRRKLQELALAFLLESALGKDRILEIYVNVIEWGPGLYGLRPAARHYFGKEPRDLSAKETAFLVVLIPGPVKYQRSFEEGRLSPGLEPLVANLLAKVRSVGGLTDADYAAAMAETLAFRPREE